MVKATTLFVCQQCGNEFPKWNGQCPACHEWETLVEVSTKDIRKTKSSHRSSTTSPISLSNTVNKDIVRVSTGLLELDRVLGGGLVGGHVVLLAGEPGIGKSTI